VGPQGCLLAATRLSDACYTTSPCDGAYQGCPRALRLTASVTPTTAWMWGLRGRLQAMSCTALSRQILSIGASGLPSGRNFTPHSRLEAWLLVRGVAGPSEQLLLQDQGPFIHQVPITSNATGASLSTPPVSGVSGAACLGGGRFASAVYCG
jgi:hypothetical protein